MYVCRMEKKNHAEKIPARKPEKKTTMKLRTMISKKQPHDHLN